MHSGANAQSLGIYLILGACRNRTIFVIEREAMNGARRAPCCLYRAWLDQPECCVFIR